MTKELGAKLASSVRQAKEKQPQKEKPDTQREARLVAPEPELPLPPLPSKRVWPD